MSIYAKKRRMKMERWRNQTEIIRKAIRNAGQVEDAVLVGELSVVGVSVEKVGCSGETPKLSVVEEEVE